MSTPTVSGTSTTKRTSEQLVAQMFGLKGDSWMRHANALSVWTRFAVLPMLAVAIWSRDWIGWWSVALVVLVLVFMVINPMLFHRPRSTRNWASKAVFGERIWADRNEVEIPPKYRRTRSLAITNVFQLAGAAVLTYGLIRLDLVDVVAGVLIMQTAKSWYLDRMVLLFEHMKERHDEYAAWEY
jgi:hypothetical protein